MRITPLDVRKQEFRKAVRGFDCDEVRAFLATLADEYETVLVDNKQIRERLADQDDKLADYQKMEKNLRDTLMTAERVMQETRDSAQKKGEIIVEEAQMKARGILEECRLRTEELRREITGLRKEKETYLARFRSLAEAQIQFIDTHRSDFEDLDRRLTDIVDSVVTRTGTAEAPAPATPTAKAAPAAVFQGPVETPAAAPAPPAPAFNENDIWRDYQPGTGGGGQPNAAPAFGTPAPAPAPAVGATAFETVADAASEGADSELNGLLAQTLTESAGAPAPQPVPAQTPPAFPGATLSGPAAAGLDAAAGLATLGISQPATATEVAVIAANETEGSDEPAARNAAFGPGGGLEPVVTEIENI